MTVTLWLDTDAEETIDLGATLPFYQAWTEIVRTGGDSFSKDYPDLAGVVSQCEDQEDADPDWLNDVRLQAIAVLKEHGDSLSDRAQAILSLLAGDEAPSGDKGLSPEAATFAEEDAFDFGDISLGGLSRDEIAEILIDAALDARDDAEFAWDEAKHPRGQPGNRGEFGPGGGAENPHESRDFAIDVHGELTERPNTPIFQHPVRKAIEDRIVHLLQAGKSRSKGEVSLTFRPVYGMTSVHQGDGIVATLYYFPADGKVLVSQPLVGGRKQARFDEHTPPAELEYKLRKVLGLKVPPEVERQYAHVNKAPRLANSDPEAAFDNAEFYDPNQARDHRGRWATGGGSGGSGLPHVERQAQRESARETVRRFMAGKGSPSLLEASGLAQALSTLTVAQLHEVKKEHGLKASSPDKAGLVKKLAERFRAAREAKPAEPKLPAAEHGEISRIERGPFNFVLYNIPGGRVEVRVSSGGHFQDLEDRPQLLEEAKQLFGLQPGFQQGMHLEEALLGGGPTRKTRPVKKAPEPVPLSSATEAKVRQYASRLSTGEQPSAIGLAAAILGHHPTSMAELNSAWSELQRAGFRDAKDVVAAYKGASPSDLRREAVKSAIGETYSPYNGTHQLLQDIAGKHDTLASALAEAERQGLIDTRQRSPQTDVSPLQRDRQGEWVRRVLGQAYGEKEAPKVQPKPKPVRDRVPEGTYGPSKAALGFNSDKERQEIEEASRQIFGEQAKPQDLATVAGAPDGANVRLRVTTAPWAKAGHVSIEVEYHGYTNDGSYEGNRTIHYTPTGGARIENNLFRGKGSGLEMFGRQVEQATRLGVGHIETHAVGKFVAGPDPNKTYAEDNGYVTWPKFGYDGPLEQSDIDRLPANLRADVQTSGGNISGLMASKEGQAWWLRNGSAINLRFDLTPGSYSQRTLAAYLEKRGILK